jgi:iron complex outermembrane receptor protein
LSDPNLKPEQSDAFELSAEKFWETHTLRVSLFHDDVTDAILRQSNILVTPTVTNVSNVDRVKTTGIEFVWKAEDLAGVRGLSIDANAAFTDSKVAGNAKDPASVDKYWLRVPKTRGNVLLAYRPTAQWMGSVGFRHEGRAYNDVYNRDINPDVFGGVSSVNQADLRLSYKPQTKFELAVGINNVNDERAFQSHPYPGRTMFLEMRASM